MYSDSFGFPRRDVARYVSADDQGKQEKSQLSSDVSTYSGILYPQPLWIEDFAGQGLDPYSVSLAN